QGSLFLFSRGGLQNTNNALTIVLCREGRENGRAARRKGGGGEGARREASFRPPALASSIDERPDRNMQRLQADQREQRGQVEPAERRDDAPDGPQHRLAQALQQGDRRAVRSRGDQRKQGVEEYGERIELQDRQHQADEGDLQELRRGGRPAVGAEQPERRSGGDLH